MDALPDAVYLGLGPAQLEMGIIPEIFQLEGNPDNTGTSMLVKLETNCNADFDFKINQSNLTV